MATRGQERCLALFPYDYWEVLQENLQLAQTTDARVRRGVRLLTAFAEDLVIDNQNRIILNPRLLEFAHIKHEALLVGAIERLELWSPEMWNEFETKPGEPTYEESVASLGEIFTRTSAQVMERRKRPGSPEETQ